MTVLILKYKDGTCPFVSFCMMCMSELACVNFEVHDVQVLKSCEAVKH